MAFTPKWTSEAQSQYKKLKDDAQASLKARNNDKTRKASKAEGLFKQVNACIQKLVGNPRHPGLQTHKYDSLPHPFDETQSVFEAYVHNNTPGAYRVLWCYGPNKGDVTIIAITPHP